MPDNKLDELNGQFIHCLFKSYNYAIYRFNDSVEGKITVTGNIGDVDLKSDYRLIGRFVDHPKYGYQFEVYSFERLIESNVEGIISYLSSDLFKGVGVKTATKIVTHFGLDTIALLKENIDILDEINIKAKVKQNINAILKTKLEYEDSFYYLLGLGLSQKDLKLILAYYKENAKRIIEENPYRPYFDIYGIGFIKCDKMASNMHYDRNCTNRNIAFLTYLTSELSFKTGHTYFSYEELASAFYSYEDNADIDFNKALNDAIEDKKVIKWNDRYYNYSQYISEKEIARFLNANNTLDFFDQKLLDETIALSFHNLKINYDEKQLSAIYAFYKYKISIVTGGAGTGKTTIIKTLVDTIKTIYPSYHVHICAPTGRAAKRISELCDVSSSTIHALLRWDLETNTFEYGIDNPLLVDVLIVDEFSMVDNWLFYKLILALNNIKKLVIIGDPNQLPSVGCGNLLKDLIEANIFKVTKLNTIFRQSDQSEIITLANDILNDQIDFNKYRDDIEVMDSDILSLKNFLIDKIKEYLNMGYEISDIEVLSPMYKGMLGINNLNNLLQDIFNPRASFKQEYQNKYRLFREGDKILQLKNQASDDIYNGDIGEIVEIVNEDSKVTILAKFNDTYVEYTSEDIDKIALAYAVSVHKAQGSEYPIIFFISSDEHRYMLNKNLIYTAISRAGKKVFILGNKNLFIASSKKAMRQRKTSLVDFLFKSDQNDGLD